LEHLRETTLVLLREKKDVSFDEILVALLHDIIEDTDMDFRSIKFLFGEKIALAVFLISKKSSLDYIPKKDEENYEKKEELQKS
jgi:(p)ppGpp synthase/HD superfamily hydrolase